MTFAAMAVITMSYAETVIVISGSGGATQSGDKITLCPDQKPQSVCATIHSDFVSVGVIVEVTVGDSEDPVIYRVDEVNGPILWEGESGLINGSDIKFTSVD